MSERLTQLGTELEEKRWAYEAIGMLNISGKTAEERIAIDINYQQAKDDFLQEQYMYQTELSWEQQ